MALLLLDIFNKKHPDIEIKAILADGLYMHAEFVDGSSLIFGGTQTITKMKYNQNVRFKNRIISVEKIFESYPLIPQKVSVRGKEDIEIFISSARLYVPSHNAKRFAIAIQYPDEKKPRYLLASDLSWRTLDKERIDNIIPFNPSIKHMSSRTFPQMKPSPSLERFRKKVA